MIWLNKFVSLVFHKNVSKYVNKFIKCKVTLVDYIYQKDKVKGMKTKKKLELEDTRKYM